MSPEIQSFGEQNVDVIKPLPKETVEVVDKQRRSIDLLKTVTRLAEKFDISEAKNVLSELQNEQDVLSREKVLTVKNIFEILKTYKLRESIGVSVDQDVEADFIKVDKILEEMSRELDRGEQLVNLREQIKSLGKDTEVESEASYRSVENLAKEYGTLLVHTFWQKKKDLALVRTAW